MNLIEALNAGNRGANFCVSREMVPDTVLLMAVR